MQTKKQSLFEAWMNVVVGYLVALTTQLIVFPILGIEVHLSQNILIGVIFTVVSLARSYLLRRLFNRLHNKLHPAQFEKLTIDEERFMCP